MTRVSFLLSVILVSIDGPLSHGDARVEWTAVTPPAILNGVCFTGKQNGIAVGGPVQGRIPEVGVSGTICRTTDGGVAWIRQETGVPQILYALSFS
jgi:hypothetical protein